MNTEKSMKLYTLGTSHGAAELNRACSTNILMVNGSYYIFDCGGDIEYKIVNLGISFADVRAVFVTHMHEDHVGKLSSIVKTYTSHNKSDSHILIHMPEQSGIDAFKGWLKGMHIRPEVDTVSYQLVTPGQVYRDENITVSAIATKHMKQGEFPSYAYLVETADKKVLYTGDVSRAFTDYPQIVFQEDFDLILCELVHYDFTEQFETIIKSRTKKMVFTHVKYTKIEQLLKFTGQFPFEVDIAEDGKIYEI